MPFYELAPDGIRQVAATTFAQEGVLERRDLQRLLRRDVGVVAPGTLVIAEEFSPGAGSRRRIDLLGVGRDASLVVVELKRTDDGGHLDLQALRYAALVAPLTFDEAVGIYATHLARTGGDADARLALLDHLGWDEPGERAFARVRIVLVSQDFNPEIIASARWLTDHHGVDIRCVRLRPHRLADGRLLIDVQQIVPPPEAGEQPAQIRRGVPAEHQARARVGVPKERLARKGDGGAETLRYAFWERLLARSGTPLFAAVSPRATNSLDAPSGVPGVTYTWIARAHAADVVLYLRDRHKVAFDELRRAKDAIEAAFGEPLAWHRQDGQTASYIKKTIATGGYADQERWPEIHEAMIDGMIRLGQACQPHLERLTR